MVSIVLVEHSGKEHRIEVEAGISVMQAVVDNMIPGVIGDCGGVCSCATCHAYIDEAWLSRLSPRSEDEEAMLEGVEEPRLNSRLTCQIVVEAPMDGLVVRLPENQF